MSKLRELHERWMEEPDYRRAYAEQQPEFDLARTLIAARSQAGLTQQELAERMNTTQSVIARLESGRAQPSTKTLLRFARATGTRLRIDLEQRSS